MAITRAQQAKQMLQDGGMLVSPSKDGKRPGYRSEKFQKAREEAMTGRKQSTFDSEIEDQTSPEDREEVRTTGGDKGSGLETRRKENEIKLKKFKDTRPKVKIPPLGPFKFIKRPLQKFSDFTTARNRAFFEDVIRAGKIPGVNFATLSDPNFDIEEAYQDYMTARSLGEIDAMGNPIPETLRRDRDEPIPFIPKPIEEEMEEVTEYVNPLSKLTPRIAGSRFLGTEFAADGGRMGVMNGGIASLEDMDREAFLLGGIAKGLKKAVRGVKKIVKSPLGRAALSFAALKFGGGLGGLKGTLFGQAGSRVGEAFIPYKEGLFTKLGLTKGGGSLIPTIKGGITLSSILPLLAGKTDEEKDDILKEYYASQALTPATTARQAGSEFDFYDYNLAEGGMPSKEPVAKKVMPLLDMDGMEKDYRAEGGFVPIGRMEKADEVPARLSKNEFVFTADAVRNAGEGDVDKGAEVMYNMMKNLESGGEVSEESQGLDGAREMFQTAQRLEEVI